MSILSSSTGLTRYRIKEDVTAEQVRDIPEKLRKFSFVDIDATTDERSFGWTNIDNFLDVKWRKSPPEKAHFMAFSLRLETRRIAPAVMKKHLQIAQEAELEKAKELGKNYISRGRKTELKEQVRIRLMARSLPIPAVFDVVWNLDKHHILVDSTNAKACSLFEDYFLECFELHLEPLTPFYLAMDMLGGEKAASKLEDLDPTIFV
ncbi:MAG: recombination-associated protein RdgC [Proteobacteria bacterium]|nr:recombination-associated protein RdgC [Pseudomonadota bacterium]MBU1612333.1 recombination-associated protein RdgC [Pseudomonadota bacterium]